jgi:hypothetical protein
VVPNYTPDKLITPIKINKGVNMTNLKRRNPLLERKLLNLSPSELPKVWDNGRKRTKKGSNLHIKGRSFYRWESK